MSESQNKLILEYLEIGNKITPLEALNNFGCFRLSSRIFDLRQKGHNIIPQKESRWQNLCGILLRKGEKQWLNIITQKLFLNLRCKEKQIGKKN